MNSLPEATVYEAALLDDMMMYPDISEATATMVDAASDLPQEFAFDPSQMTHETMQDSVASCEGFSASYIPHTYEHDIQSMQALSAYDPSAAPTYFVPPQPSTDAQNVPLSPHPESASAHPASMDTFFQMMSHPDNVQAYIQFLQTKHEQASQATLSPTSARSRSNSNPSSNSLPSAFAMRPASNEAPIDSATREKKLAKYRTKRARRLTGSQLSSSDSNVASGLSAPEPIEGDRFMPAPKIQKTLTHDLENRLMSSEEEVKMLRSALESREAELQMLHQFLFEEQQQYQQWAMHNFGEGGSNASSSAATSPRPHSPSTPAMVSSPSSMSLGSSTMDADFSMDTSSMGSDHMMEVMAANSKRQEKLKQLGGPPSDVYHPWWNGTSLNHPAFSQKEDWQHFELRPQERLAQERLNYFLMMQRYRVEQNAGPVTPKSPAAPNGASSSSHVPAHAPFGAVAGASSAGNSSSHHASLQHPQFYQSPHHHSHIMTGSPAQSSGFWSGHFAPANDEKIDFSKISLRKTPAPNMDAMGGMTGMNGMPTMPSAANRLAPPTSAAQSPQSPNSSAMATSPTSPASPQVPHMMQPSPTAAIWRDAMAHPEMHRYPTRQLSWIQAQSQPQQHRAPFRRAVPAPTPFVPKPGFTFTKSTPSTATATNAPATAASLSNNRSQNRTQNPATPASPQQQVLQQQLQQQLQQHLQQQQRPQQTPRYTSSPATKTTSSPKISTASSPAPAPTPARQLR